MNDQATGLREGWSVTSYTCPVCSNPLFKIEKDERVTVWCGRANNICPSAGANEGGSGKNEKEAWAVFRMKMGLDRRDRKEEREEKE